MKLDSEADFLCVAGTALCSLLAVAFMITGSLLIGALWLFLGVVLWFLR